tara:strand:+ start:231 stop:617 length:387 start_codon:yes stop_codon:yes gene_type:complete
MTDFNQLSKDINKWLKYNESIDSINSQLKIIKDQKNKLEESILFNLKTHNLTDKKLKIGDKHINYNITNTMPPLSLKLLDTILEEFLDNKIKEKILEKIKLYREHHKTESVSLKKKNINRKRSTKCVK